MKSNYESDEFALLSPLSSPPELKKLTEAINRL